MAFHNHCGEFWEGQPAAGILAADMAFLAKPYDEGRLNCIVADVHKKLAMG